MLVESLETRRLMSASVTVVGTAITFNEAGTYSFENVPSNQPKVKIKVNNGHATLLPKAQFDSLNTYHIGAGAIVPVSVGKLPGLTTIDGERTLNVTGVEFREADVAPQYNFEPSYNFDSLIQSDFLLGSGAVLGSGSSFAENVAPALDHLLVNGTRVDSIKVLWDYLDGGYTSGSPHSQYYNNELNLAFVNLGLEYLTNLEDGGPSLADVTAKFAPDGGDVGTRPDRMQSMHDNLLGNFDAASLNDKFGANPALLAAVKNSIPVYIQSRGIYGGYESQYGGPSHLDVITFDVEQGWYRPDADLIA